MAEKSVAEQVAEITARWNPPPEDHTLERVVGVPTEAGDVAATAHIPADDGFTSPEDDSVDAQRGDYTDDLDGSGDGGTPDFDDTTVEGLKDGLRDAGKPVSGSKQELYDRLYNE